MQGGEVFIPKIPTTTIVDLVEAIAPGCAVDYTGIRPGEKLHESMLSEDESPRALELEDMYVVQPTQSWWSGAYWSKGKPVPEGFSYVSSEASYKLSPAQIRSLLHDAGIDLT